MKLELYDEAIVQLNSILDEDDSNPDTCNFLGVCYHSKKDFDTAHRWYSKAIELNGTEGSYWSNRGELYLDFKHNELAVDDFQHTITLKKYGPNKKKRNALIYYKAGLASYRCGSNDKAIDYLGYVSCQAPSDQIKKLTYPLFIKLKEYLSAALIISDLMDSIGKNDVKLNLDQAFCFLQMFREEYKSSGKKNDIDSAIGYYQMGIQNLDKVIQLDPTNAKAYSLRARFYLLLGFTAQAEEDVSKAISLKPEIIELYQLWDEIKNK